MVKVLPDSDQIVKVHLKVHLEKLFVHHLQLLQHTSIHHQKLIDRGPASAGSPMGGVEFFTSRAIL